MNIDKQARSQFNLSIVIQKFIILDRLSETVKLAITFSFCFHAAISGI